MKFRYYVAKQAMPDYVRENLKYYPEWKPEFWVCHNLRGYGWRIGNLIPLTAA